MIQLLGQRALLTKTGLKGDGLNLFLRYCIMMKILHKLELLKIYENQSKFNIKIELHF